MRKPSQCHDAIGEMSSSELKRSLEYKTEHTLRSNERSKGNMFAKRCSTVFFNTPCSLNVGLHTLSESVHFWTEPTEPFGRPAGMVVVEKERKCEDFGDVRMN